MYIKNALGDLPGALFLSQKIGGIFSLIHTKIKLSYKTDRNFDNISDNTL